MTYPVEDQARHAVDSNGRNTGENPVDMLTRQAQAYNPGPPQDSRSYGPGSGFDGQIFLRAQGKFIDAQTQFIKGRNMETDLMVVAQTEFIEAQNLALRQLGVL